MPFQNVIGETIHTYIWQVGYKDGNSLVEHDGGDLDTPCHAFSEVDKENVRSIALVSTMIEAIPSHVVHVPEDATVDFKRRHIIRNVGTENQIETVVAIVTWTIPGEIFGQSMHHYFFEDGSVATSAKDLDLT